MQFPNLHILIPTPEYLLAMKCLASRVGSVTGAADDRADIKFLARHLGLNSPNEALEIVARYYPAEKLPAITPALLESVFEELKGEP